MTERLYLHVGAPKSGTTYLQSVLRANRERLADAGVLVVGDRHVEVVHAGLIIREDPRVANLSPDEARSWQRLVDAIKAWQGRSAILSYELLAGASAEQARAALAQLPGIEIHIVFTARDFARALPSAWQERLKFGLARPLEKWVPKGEDDGPRAEWGWRTMDPSGVTERWAADLPPAQVHIVTVPRSGAAPDELWQRFARACDLDVPGLDLAVTTANESLTPASAELLRRVNRRLGPPITGNREHARWIRDLLAHQVLVPLGKKEGLGMTDEQFEQAVARSDAAIEQLRTRGYDVQGDLEEIRATRPTGRTPGEVGDAELVRLAAQAIADLLVRLRAATIDRTTDGGSRRGTVATEPDEPLRERVKSGARRAAENTAATYVNKRMDKMAERIAELEAEVQRGRVLQRRVAELDDLVCELLVPTAGQSDDILVKAIKKYRKDSL
ncbi:MAG: hypothetical protein JWR35_2162 [Marmoricola sp.]|nr:hypothetical protein [Marmoricola sp.]